MNQESDPLSFLVATWNIAGQERMGYPKRSQKILEAFAKLPCNLIGFQEFGVNPSNPVENNWVQLQSAHPEMDIYLGKQAHDIYINPIAWDKERFEIVDKDTFWLSEDETYRKGWDGAERGASWVVLRDKLADGKLYLHINTHPDNIGTVARIESIKQILRFIDQRFPKLPVILTADSNTSVDSPFKRTRDAQKKTWQDPELREPYELMLKAGFQDAWVASHPNNPTRPVTFHNFVGDQYAGDGWGTADTEWIMVRGFQVKECMVVPDNEASDHYAMMALVTPEV